MKSRTPRSKPEWNVYLTDDARYKLNQRQQLQRQLQQLSAAHFAAKSPASRRRRAAASAHSSAWSTPQDKERRQEAPRSRATTPVKRRSRSLADARDSGELQTARRLQFADVSLDLEEETPRRRDAAVSFNVEEKLDSEQKASLQGELEVLEKMLRGLETETDRLSWQQTPQKQKIADFTARVKEFEPQKEEEEEGDEEARLGDVCFRSLEIGLELARKMDSMSKELENERRLRDDRDLKIELLEQEVRSTQAKCNYLEAKYQSVSSQREAVIATEEAIHRMTLAFEYSQRRRGKSSNPSTPNKRDSSKISKKSSTPKKPSTPLKQKENWLPNNQQH
ncbi:hypothetical protein PHYBOEH_004261 [Phytophthora boehmeriae]|uniref:Uncharacterized protein n=1 Tax=Phytophthora boehmeriae TaxID=109152 RepID=A0A8T1WR90_9STRA|nr:hypothetical protein PHYBOEH_004261 [Phytophthora boehmeriae]